MLAHLRPWDGAVGTGAYLSSQLRGQDPWVQPLGARGKELCFLPDGLPAHSYAMTVLSTPGLSTNWARLELPQGPLANLTPSSTYPGGKEVPACPVHDPRAPLHRTQKGRKKTGGPGPRVLPRGRGSTSTFADGLTEMGHCSPGVACHS